MESFIFKQKEITHGTLLLMILLKFILTVFLSLQYHLVVIGIRLQKQ